jgi:hypothetical protein
MKGRIYDYTLGRFLSVDPIIGNPMSSQSLNPYSYLGNNPLSGRDPTGYEACTGSNIDRNDGSSCAGQGVSGGGFNNPSKDQLTAAAASPNNGHQNQPTQVVSQNAQEATASTNIGTMNNPTAPIKPQPAGDNNGLTTTLLEGITVTPSFEQRFDDWQSRDTAEFLSTPIVAGVGFITGTNPWRENKPGDDSIQSAAMPGAWGLGIKGAAVGLAVLRDASRIEETFDVLSDIPSAALRFGVNDPPARLIGPWTQRDLARAVEGKGPLDFIPMTNAAGHRVPLELHHAGQMPGSGIHEVPPFHSGIPGIHPNQYNQGVSGSMRTSDAQLHWQMRGQEMGNPPPGY